MKNATEVAATYGLHVYIAIGTHFGVLNTKIIVNLNYVGRSVGRVMTKLEKLEELHGNQVRFYIDELDEWEKTLLYLNEISGRIEEREERIAGTLIEIDNLIKCG